MLDEPAGLAHTGGATAAPLFARVAAGHLVRHGILTRPKLALPRTARAEADHDAPEPQPAPKTRRPSSGDREETQSTVLIATLNDRLLLPDFRGLSISEVKKVTAGIGLEVEMRGWGRVVSQDPAPGTILAGSTRRVSVRFAPRGEDG
jgi:hypothetical protein